MEECPTPAALFLLSSAFNQFIQQNMWLSKKLHTYLLCVGAKSKMKANNGISCCHPACIFKQHGHVGQCQDSFPSQDLAVTKYRVKKQTPLTTQVLVAQYHVVIWIHGFPLCRPATLKQRKISSDWWQQSQSWLIWQVAASAEIGHVSTNLLLLWFLLEKILKSMCISGGLLRRPSGNQVK